MPEIWKDVVGWEGVYSVSDAGRIRYEQDRPSRRYSVHAGDMVAQSPDGDGYLSVKLARVGDRAGRRGYRVSRIVAAAFIGPSPFAGAEVDHKNHRRSDNAADNLEWVTSKENIARAIRVGLRDFRGERCDRAKLTGDQILEIRRRAAGGEAFLSLARAFGCTNVNIAQIATGRTWAHIDGPRVSSR